MLAREGREKNYPGGGHPVAELAALPPISAPAFPPNLAANATTNAVGSISPLRIYTLLNQLSKSNTLCYFNPSFGYYFEQFYQEPHGLIYVLKPLPEDTLLPPALDKNLIAENESFWTRRNGKHSAGG